MTWTTASVYRESEDAVTIVFDTNGTSFAYKAGQFINLSLEIEGELLSRSYSLSSSPGEDEKPSITVKKIDGGLVSSYIFDHAGEITGWLIDGPYGNFVVDDVNQNSQVVLFAAGSGITPVFSIIKYLLKFTNCQVQLIYSTRNWQNAIFRSVLSYLAGIFPQRFRILYFFTGVDGVAGYSGGFFTGRMSRLAAKKFLGGNSVKLQSAKYFVCGPAGFIEHTENMLQSWNVDAAQVSKELFYTGEVEAASGDSSVFEVLLHYREQTNLLEVMNNQSILEAALADKIPLPYSCKTGNCGVCVGRLVGGEVMMRHHAALMQGQINEGKILLCQAFPVNNEVAIEVEKL